MAIFWNDQVDISVEVVTDHFIHLLCHLQENKQLMHITLLHAPIEFKDRVLLWEEIQKVNAATTLPWLYMADFNEILYPWEKVRKKEAEHYRLTAFRDFLHACSLMDLESKGCVFTWNNRREGEELVKKRLNRALSTMEWRIEYPNAEVVAMPAIGSDHSPLLLLVFPRRKNRKKEFRYEAFWDEDEECEQIVKIAWCNSASPGADLVAKLRLMSNQLAEWSKNCFPNAQKRVEMLRNELQYLQNRPELSEDS